MELCYFLNRRAYLEAEIARLETELKQYPPGEFTIYENKGHTRWVLLGTGDSNVFLSKKKDHKQAEIMAIKKFKSDKCADLKNELESINEYIKHRSENGWQHLLDKTSHYRPFLIRDNDWEYAPYKKKEDDYDNKHDDAPKGEKVRSKSEALIAQCLFDNGIPYHYEEVHDFNGIELTPDFTIKHPTTGKIYLWEHFGKAEKENYQGTIAYKMPIYLGAGYIPGFNFITTYETKTLHLSFEAVRRTVAEYFL